MAWRTVDPKGARFERCFKTPDPLAPTPILLLKVHFTAKSDPRYQICQISIFGAQSIDFNLWQHVSKSTVP